jgi:hypothetical protein
VFRVDQLPPGITVFEYYSNTWNHGVAKIPHSHAIDTLQDLVSS